MEPRSFSRVETLYHAALERPPGERDRFLRDACAGDSSLLREVTSLLAVDDEARRLLEEPAAAAVTQKLTDLRGTRLGPYQVSERIGAGGMGEVYRARDTRLGREVAIKVIREEAAGDAEQVRRFEREARSAAALNHPNITTVFEVGEHDGTRFIAMELVEGETLKTRLEGGPLPVREMLALATQIASALAKAHAAGIVHRDLKPGNLMVTSDGLVKILDFGLARRLAHAPDVESGITREGTLLGTVQYMSPEQAAARPIDHRSDQFSFGAILYEMATGKRAFERDTAPQTLAAILEDEPAPARTLNAEIPAGLQAIVARCLAKDPSRRYDSTADLARALDACAAAAASAPTPSSRQWLRVSGLMLFAAAAAIGLYRLAIRENVPEPPVTAPLAVVPLTTYPGREGEPSLSPDGSLVAFTWNGPDRNNQDIYVKAIGAEQPLRLTSNPSRDGSPAWSPDGTRIAFLRDRPGGGSLVLLVPPTGGAERRLAESGASAAHGLSWCRGGRGLVIVDRLSPAEPFALFRVDSQSGEKVRLTAPQSGTLIGDRDPAVGPDGDTVAFKRVTEHLVAQVHVVTVEGGEPRLLPTKLPLRGRLAWAPGGDAIVSSATPATREGGPPGLSAQGPDASRVLWRIPVDGGPAVPLDGTLGAVDAAVASGGHGLAYARATMDSGIWRIDLQRPGSSAERHTRLMASTALDWNPRFSPGGERVAFTSTRSGSAEIWAADADGGRLLRLTFLGKDGVPAAPSWSPDGESLAFELGADGSANRDIYVISAAGGAPRRVTTADSLDLTPSWSRDGRFVYFGSNRSGQWQVWKVASDGEQPGSARQVTRRGGFAPTESVDGRHVYFCEKRSGSMAPDNALWRAPVAGGDEELVVGPLGSSFGNWDVTAKGIYFVDRRPSSAGVEWVVQFLAFGRQRATEVARLERPPFLAGPAFSVSSDGRRILSAQVQDEADLMLVEGFR